MTEIEMRVPSKIPVPDTPVYVMIGNTVFFVGRLSAVELGHRRDGERRMWLKVKEHP